MDSPFLDSLLSRNDLKSIKALYRTSNVFKNTIDSNLIYIARYFRLGTDVKTFSDVVRKYEDKIVLMPLHLGLKEAVKYSPRLVERILNEHPYPIEDWGEDFDPAYYKMRTLTISDVYEEEYPILNLLINTKSKVDVGGDFDDEKYEYHEGLYGALLEGGPDEYIKYYYNTLIGTAIEAIEYNNIDALEILIETLNDIFDVTFNNGKDLSIDLESSKELLLKTATGNDEAITVINEFKVDPYD